jgi:hypothetical protein
MINAVIQGSFTNGVRIGDGYSPGPSGRVMPDWVRAKVVQPLANRVQPAPQPAAHHLRSGKATQVPPQLAAFPNTGGDPLPPVVLQRMEALFGTQFRDVRVHTSTVASAIGAVAFTSGSHIHFAPGRYDPHSARGQQLVAHELTHVVQQRVGRVRNPFGQGVAVIEDNSLEAEAHRMEMRASTLVLQRSSEASSSAASSSSSAFEGFQIPKYHVKKAIKKEQQETKRVELVTKVATSSKEKEESGEKTTCWVWAPDQNKKTAASGYDEAAVTLLKKYASKLSNHLITLKNVPLEEKKYRSGFSCAEPNAVALLAGDKIALKDIRVSKALNKDNVYIKPCANCATWLEEAEYADSVQWYKVKVTYL